MRDAGRLHGDELACGEESICAGDVVVLRLNDPRRGVTNGDPVVAHGYAVTGHVAQGLTTDRAFVLASDELYREWA